MSKASRSVEEQAEFRRLRRRLYADEEVETTGGGGGRLARDATATASSVASAAAASSSDPPPATKVSSSSSPSEPSSAVTVVVTVARSHREECLEGSGKELTVKVGPDGAIVGTPNGIVAASAELAPPRAHAFSSETWWMIDLDANPPQGATRLVKTCMRAYGWDSNKARAVLRAYRQFLFLKTKYKDYDAKMLSPSQTVDMMWHQHILDVVNYIHDCALLCGGRIVGHDPRGSEQGPERDERRRATRQALLQHKGEIGIEDEEWKELLDGIETDTLTKVETSPMPGATEAPAAFSATASSAESESDGEQIQLYVEVADGLGFTITVPECGTASHAYNKVASMTGIPDCNFRLLCDGKLMGHHMPIREYGLMDESIIELEKAILLRVTTPIGSTFTVEVWPDSGQLSGVYDKVYVKMGIPPRLFQLFFEGRPLDRGSSITPRAFGLTDESKIYVMMAAATTAVSHSPDNNERPIQVVFKTLTGRTITVDGLWPDSGRVSDMFHAIHAVEDLHPNKCRLTYAGKQLKYDEHTSLRTIGLQNKSTVHLTARLRGC